jgi:septal ring factor EnvC (AmiA/AmiB activator)
MKPAPEEIAALAKQVAEAEATLQKLEWEIEEIGQPAAHELQRRLDALKIEERALQRNLTEALGMDDPGDARMAKIEALLAWIQSEEAAVGRESEFLHQSPPTSSEFAAQAGSRILDLCLRALKRVVGEHHPLGMSVFVNHSPDLLKQRYGVGEAAKSRPGETS